MALLLCACRSAPPHPRRWADAWVNSLNSHRWAQVAPLLTDGSYEDPLTGKPLGILGAQIYWTQLWVMFPGLRFTVRRVTGDDRRVAVEWTVDGVDSGSATPVSGIFVLRIRGDAIMGVRGYYNAIPFIFHTAKPAPPA